MSEAKQEQLERGWLMPHLERNSRRWRLIEVAHNGSDELIDQLIAVLDSAAPRPTGGRA